jgi:hypothetical protein
LTGAEIKTLYEGEEDTNAFTDAEKSKLAAISGTNTGDQDLSGLMVKSANLSDVANVSTARTNLGLGTAATTDSTAYAPALGPDDNYVTDAEKTVIGNTSGTNTGDQDLSGYVLTESINTLSELNAVVTDATLIDTNDARLSDARTPTSHTHGNLTNGGAIGTTSGLPIKTGTSGVLEAGAFGTSAGQFAEGNHTHSQLHDRSHSITSTSDHTAGNHKVFYSNGSGEVTELALGADGTYLKSNGSTSAPSFETPSGGASTFLDLTDSPASYSGQGGKVVAVKSDASGLEFVTGGGGGGSKTLARFTHRDNQPPTSNFATLDTRNSIAVLDFDDTTKESSVFVGVIPEGAVLTSGLSISIFWMATTATSGDCRWEVALERGNTDLDADSFDTAQVGTTTTSGTSGIPNKTTITLTTIDSVAVGEFFRLRVARDAANGADTMAGDAELIAVEIQQVA